MRYLRRGAARWILAGAGILVALFVTLGSTGQLGGVLRDLALASNPTPPVNDDFADALAIAPTAASFSGSTVGATVESGEPATTAGDQTVWYTWAPTAPGVAYLIPEGSSSLPSVRAYTGSAVTALTRVDVPGAAASPGTTAIDALPGTVYFLQVDAAAGQAGPFSFTILSPDAGAPTNDSFSASTSLEQAVNDQIAGIGSNPVGNGTTAGATAEPGEPGNPVHSVWYDWTAPPGQAGSLTLTVSPTSPAGASLHAAVYTGTSVASLTPVAGQSQSVAGSSQSVTFSVVPGTAYYFQVDGDQAYFTLATTETGLSGPDTTPPTVSCTPPTGWQKDNVAVPCTAFDDGSGLADPAQASFTLSTAVAAGSASASATTPTATVCDLAGNCATAGPYTIEVDRTAPVVSCPPAPSQWAGGTVTITCLAADPTGASGLADPADASFVLTASIPAGTESSDAAFSTHPPVCSVAGTCTPVPAPAPARIDLSAPVVSCGSPPAGWHGGEVAVACTASDSGSGLANPDDASFSLSTDVGQGAESSDAFTASRQVCDRAGNCTTATPVGPIEVDRQPPAVTCTPPPGWQQGDTVSVSCTASDGGSGLATASQSSFSLTASIPAGSQGSAFTGSEKICDAAGNCATAGPLDVALDDSGPQVTCQPTPTAWQAVQASVSCTAIDVGSGLADPTQATFTLTATVPAGTASAVVTMPSRQICDAVGNCTQTPPLAPARIDDQTPLVTCANPQTGTHYGEVVVACTSSDQAGSGLADPAQAAFTLTTGVGAGNHDSSAMTGSTSVCDEVGLCTSVGPLGPFDVDRSVVPPDGPPTLELPSTINVLAAEPTSAVSAQSLGGGSIAVPYPLPTSSADGEGPVDVGCSPAPGQTFSLGRTVVVCNATDQADRSTTMSVDVVVNLAPTLAPAGPAAPGRPWTAVGYGYAPASTVQILVDSTPLGTTTATSSGRIDATFTFPASAALGPHTVVASGTGPDGQPNLVVTPLAVALNSAAVTTTTVPPTGSPPVTSSPPVSTSPPVTSSLPPVTAPPPVTGPPPTTVTTPAPAAGTTPTVAPGLGPPTPFVPASPGSRPSPTPGLPSASTPTSTPGSTAKTPGSTTFGGGAPGQTHSALPGIHPVHGGFDWWILLLIALGALGAAAFAAIGWRTYSSARRR